MPSESVLFYPRKVKHPLRVLFFCLVAALAACSSVPADDTDPLEPANRKVHGFNKGLDAHVIGPVADIAGDDDGEPNGALIILANVGDNLSLPGKMLNHSLQGRPDKVAHNGARFAINSTLGVAGIMDPAGQEFELYEEDTDFGETLHVWGVGEGPYLELPVLGPSTTRHAAGRVVDWAIDPMGRVLNQDQAKAARLIRLASKAGDRARFGDTVDSVLHESADSYTQARLLYLQHRRYELGQEAEEIDPYAE